MEFKELADYLIKTHGDTHYMKYKVRSAHIRLFLESPRLRTNPYS